MARNLGLLPGRQALVDLDQRLVRAAGQTVDLFVNAHGLVGSGHGLELGDLAFEIGNRLFKIEIGLHSTCPLGVCCVDPVFWVAAVAP